MIVKITRNLRYLIGTVFILSVLSGCVTVKYHDYAETDFDLATKYIHQIKDDTLVIALTSYEDEEDIYKRAIKYGNKDVEKNKTRLAKLINRRKVEYQNMINAFEDNFSFAEILYMPDSLVHSFERGEERPFFLNTNGELDPSITYNNRSPIKILQQGGIQWTVVIGNKILPNPFPNGYNYKNGLAVFLGIASHEKITLNLAKTFQKRFERYYSNPASRLYY
jgi:hypothetical protein